MFGCLVLNINLQLLNLVRAFYSLSLSLPASRAFASCFFYICCVTALISPPPLFVISEAAVTALTRVVWKQTQQTLLDPGWWVNCSEAIFNKLLICWLYRMALLKPRSYTWMKSFCPEEIMGSLKLRRGGSWDRDEEEEEISASLLL